MSGIIELPCLGRPFRLGSLYDCQTDTLLSETLWDDNVIESVLQTSIEGSESLIDTIIADINMGEKMLQIGLNPDLRLSILSGLLKGVSGPIVRFLEEKSAPHDQARVYMRCQTISKVEEINTDKIKFDQKSSKDSKQATHVVFKLQQGTDAFFAFDSQIKSDKTRAEVQSNMKQLIEALKHTIISKSTKNVSSEKLSLDGKTAEECECKFYYGDVNPHKTPSSLSDVVEVCRDYPLNLADKNKPNLPKNVWLLPLSQLITNNESNQQVTIEVSQEVATYAQKILQAINEQSLQVSHLLSKHDATLCKFSSLQNRLLEFQKLITTFDIDIKERIRSQLPKVRCGTIKETEMVEQLDETPFNPDLLSAWLTQKLKEVEELNEVFKSDLEFTEEIPPRDCQVDKTVCFVCNITQMHDELLEAMGKCLQTKKLIPSGTFLHETQLERVPVLSKRFEKFKSYANLNKDTKKVKFVVADTNYDHSTDCAITLLCISGKCQLFELPSAPGTLVVDTASAAHSSIQLNWSKPTEGSENVKSYNIYYCPQKENEPKQWKCIKTTDPSTSVAISDLDSDTKYLFKVFPILAHAAELVSNPAVLETAPLQAESEADYTQLEVCKPGKPTALSATHNSVHLRWAKPRYSSEYIQMYIISYRPQDRTESDWKQKPHRGSEEKKITNLEAKKSYLFKVRPKSRNPEIKISESQVSDPIETTPTCKPGKPEAVVITHNSIKLCWSKPEYESESVDFYLVNFRKLDDVQWSDEQFTEGPQEMLTVSGLILGAEYVFMVSPMCKHGTKCADSDISDPIKTKRTCQTGKPEAYTVTHKSISIKWDKPDYGYDHVNFFLVSYRKVGEQQWKKETADKDVTTMKVCGLSVLTKYVFQVRPNCDSTIEAIDSECSDPIETIPTCQPGKPEAALVTHNSVSLKWDKPKHYHDCVGLYVVAYKSERDEPQKWFKQTTTGVVEKIEISGLSMGTKYTFKVTAECNDDKCKIADSDSSEIETMATSKPSKPFARNIRHNEIDIAWKRPESGDTILSYNIMARLMDESSEEWTPTNTHSNEETTTLKGLKSNRKYCFKVIPVCKSACGMESDVSDPIETSPASQPGKPTATNITHNSIEISWEPGYHSHEIKQYQISYYSLSGQDSSSSSNKQKPLETKGSQTSIIVSNLSLDTEYVFKVLPVCTVAGITTIESEESDPIRTKAASPPQGIKSAGVTHDSIHLKWSKPKSKISSHKILSYTVAYQTIQDAPNEWKTQKTNDAKETVTVNGLNASTKYLFKVIANYASPLQVGAESDVTKPIETKPTCKPGEINALSISHNAIHLQWAEPVNFSSKVLYYTISYHTGDGKWIDVEPRECKQQEIEVDNLVPNTGYIFKVEPACRSKTTQSTESNLITTKATSKPGTPTVQRTFHDSIDMAWKLPQCGSENISSFIVYYHSTAETQGKWREQETEGLQTSMTVSGLTLNSKYLFKVLAKCTDGEGSESDTSTPIQTNATSPPSKPIATEITHNSVVLKWNKPEFGSGGIKYYTVSFWSKGSPSTESHVKTLRSDKEYITVTGLTAKTEYTFQVSAECEVGIGSASEPSDCIETQLSCKTSTPVATSITHESVDLKWSKPRFAFKTVQHYNISYWPSDDPQDVKECKVNASEDSVNIQGLSLNAGYKFEISPYCVPDTVTESSISDVITTKATSKPGKPVACVITHNSIELKWSKPRYGSKSVKSYTVFYHLESSEDWTSQETNCAQEYIVIDNLLALRKYTFKVCTVCVSGAGSESDITDPVETRATSPPGKPRASLVIHDSVYLEWSPPEYGIQNISAYSVSYCTVQEPDSECNWETQTVSSAQTALTIAGLKMNTRYIFKVQPKCKLGIGSESNISDSILTKATSKPSKPQVTLTTSDTVKLEWNPPVQGAEHIKSYSISYHSTLAPDSNWEEYKTNSNDNNAFISGLTVNTQYVFKVLPECSQSYGVVSDESDLCLTKATSAPGLPKATRVTHDTIELSWSKPQYGGENVKAYMVYCRMVTEDHSSQEEGVRKIPSPKENVIIRKLSSRTSYVFKVQTMCGRSLQGMETDWCQRIETKVTSPPGKPMAVFDNISHDTIQIQWSKPELGNEFFDNYSVYYQQYDPIDPLGSEWLCMTEIALECIAIPNLTPKTKYVFKVEPECRVGSGSESEISDVIETKKSSNPGKPFATEVTHDTIDLEWDKPEHGSEGIKYYTVVFHSDVKPDKEEQRKGTDKCSLRIQNLKPHTKYHFKVRSEFKSGSCTGYSVYSDPIQTKVTSKPGKPEALVSDLTHNSIQLQWTEPKYGKTGILYYCLYYRQENGTEWIQHATKCVQMCENLTDLTPGEKYVFKLCPVCKEGEGSESDVSDVIETKATSPPCSLIARVITHNSIQLQWKKPNLDIGTIISYFVYYRKSEDQSLNWLRKQTEGIQETIVLENLNSNIKYDIKVLPECQTGIGTECKRISITTKATSKPGPPIPLLALHSEIHLQWSKPEYGSKNISSYTLSYRSTDNTQWVKLQVPVVSDTESVYFKVEKLTPGKKYVFKVLPRCTQGSGMESDTSEPVETKLTAQPGTPKATATHNSASLRWTKPKSGCEFVTGYVVKYKEENSEADWKEQECETNESIVGGLTAGKIYVFKVHPVCNGGIGAESDTSIPIETKSTSQPGKPKAVESGVTHDSINVIWTSPKFGTKNITGYTVFYCRSDDTSDNWEKCNTQSPNELTLRVNKLQAKTKYIFLVRPMCASGIGADSEYSDPIETKPSCKPGKPFPKDEGITHHSMELTWNQPEFGNVVRYTVFYRKHDSSQWMREETRENLVKLEKLTHKTIYDISVFPQCEDALVGVDYSDMAILTTRQIPLAERIKAKSKLKQRGTQGSPDIYVVPVKVISEDRGTKIRKCFVGEDNSTSTRVILSGRVIMLVGATGAGKTTLINGLVNYVFGVQWKHNYRFKIIDEESQLDQSRSQTKWITSYTVQDMEESPIKYPLTIIDTPGFGDTEGIERDQRLVDQIRAFFSAKGTSGIDQIHAIGFVTQSALARLTATQKYIFHSIMSIFGKDVKTNICLMATFADGQAPPVLNAIKAAEVPYHKHFKFNNSALFAPKATSVIDKMFWEMGETSFKEFFQELSITTPKSLTLTKKVLEERQHLEACVEGLQFQVRDGLSKIDALRQEEEILKKHEAQLHLNQDFTYTIEVTKQRMVDLNCGEHVTNCLNCNLTCHYPCYIPQDTDKYNCAAMGDKRNTPEATCNVCPGKCHWKSHVNNPYRFELYQVEERKTSDDLKQRYQDAKGGKLQVENMITKIRKELDDWYQKVHGLIRQVQQSLKRLQEIALKPNPLTEVAYIELLIESEKQEAKPGFQNRIKSLEKVKEKAKLLGKFSHEAYDPANSPNGWKELLDTAV